MVGNENLLKYLLSSKKQSRHLCLGSHNTVDTHNFEIRDNFLYLTTGLSVKYNGSLEIQRRNTLANKCYFGLSRQLKIKLLFWRIKAKLFTLSYRLATLYRRLSCRMCNNTPVFGAVLADWSRGRRRPPAISKIRWRMTSLKEETNFKKRRNNH